MFSGVFGVSSHWFSSALQKEPKTLLLNSLLGHAVGSTNKPSMARQRIMEEERERAVQAYRKLKKQKQEQRDRAAGLEKAQNFS